jgi:putative chitinase
MALDALKNKRHIRELSKDNLCELQELLQIYGYPVEADGECGPNTIRSFNEFKEANYLGELNYITTSTISKLKTRKCVDDTPLSSIEQTTVIPLLTKEQLTKLQSLLNLRGYDVLIDGKYGEETLIALNSFKADKNLDEPGFLCPTTVNLLLNKEIIVENNLVYYKLLDLGMPLSSIKNIKTYLSYIQKYTKEYEINTPLRVAAFLSQLAYVSESLNSIEEISSGANYEYRYELGNEVKGDGKLYKGRGLRKIRGKNEYKLYSDLLQIDLMNEPTLALEPDIAVQLICEFWKQKDLNKLADAQNIQEITKIVTGDITGLWDCMNFYISFRGLLGV